MSTHDVFHFSFCFPVPETTGVRNSGLCDLVGNEATLIRFYSYCVRFSSLGRVEDPKELANGEVHFTNSTRESMQFKNAPENDKDTRTQENRWGYKFGIWPSKNVNAVAKTCVF